MAKVRLTHNQIVRDYLDTLPPDSDGFLSLSDALSLYPELRELLEDNSPSMDDSDTLIDFSSSIQTMDENKNWWWSDDETEFAAQKSSRSS